MLFSIVTSLSIVTFAFAAPPAAQATYCSEDNLLRAFQHTPIPASSYCLTSTDYPTFIAATTYPATRLSSACSCYSRIPSETPAPACSSTTKYRFKSVGALNGYGTPAVDLILTISKIAGCEPFSEFVITNVCGVFKGNAITFNPSIRANLASYCWYPGPADNIDFGGINFIAGGEVYNMYEENIGGSYFIDGPLTGTSYPGQFKSVCGPTALC